MTGHDPVVESGMPYAYFEHISDMGIEAAGETLAAAVESGVEAVLNAMFDLDTIDEAASVEVTASARDVETLFVEVINEVISLQGRDELALKRLHVDKISYNGEITLSGVAYGEKFDPEKHDVRTEVKGATYSGLSYNNGVGGVHVLRCVIDV